MTKLVLVISDLDKKMRVKTDVSDFAMEGVLLIKYKDEKWRSVAYISKSLNEAKKTIKFIIRCWLLSDV